MLELLGEGVPINEIAVLYRAHYHSMELQMEMVRRGIPFEIRSGIRFFEQAHIKDVTSYMRIIVNPFDEVAWKRVLGLYSKIGKATCEKLWKYLSIKENPLEAALGDDFSSLVTKSQRQSLAACRHTLGKIRDSLSGASPAAIIGILLESGYQDYLQEKYTDAASRVDDLDQLANYSGKFTDLEDFLSELSLMTNMTEASDTSLDDTDEDKVILSSIHQAKGLEWSVVFMIWCSDGMLPLARSLNDQDGEEEERRLFYVATTRAKDQLYLCYPQVSYARGIGSIGQIPSRFIREVSPSSRQTKACPYDQWMVEEDSDY
jgi:DNA helicase-2/ATP-dependent DNA helicase PcrA